MTRKHDVPEDPRRRLLLQALATGFFAARFCNESRAEVLGNVPHRLPLGKSIYELNGSVTINGIKANMETSISAGSVLETAKDSHAIFVVGNDAFIMRENSQLHISGDGFVVHGLRLVTGALLSVFGKAEHRLETSTATAGIRGTGLYAEAMPDLSYICTCYGTTEIASTDVPGNVETVTATHHSARYISSSGEQRVRKAPFKNHTDLELMLIEALVGRVPPFALFDDSYGSPRRY